MRRVGVAHAIFFGSRERGNERPHSDLNLVLLDERFEGRPLAVVLQELQRAWKSDLHIEILACSPVEFEEMQEWNPLAREAAKRGARIDLCPDAEESQP